MTASRNPVAVAVAATGMAIAAFISTAFFATALFSVAQAADYPAKPIRLLIPQPPGGPTDIGGRTYADKLRAALNQSVVVENRPGANTIIAINTLIKSPGDGYTIYYGSNGFSNLPFMVKDYNVNWQTETTPITTVASLPTAIAVTTALPIHNLDEFLADIRANPGKRNYAGMGSVGEYMTMEGFRRAAGNLNWLTVNYNGAAAGFQGLAAGDIQIIYTTLGPLKPLADSGKLRILVVSGSKRSALAPDVPSISEAKEPALRALAGNGFRPSWQGIIGPAKVPADAVNAIARATAKINEDADFKKRLLDIGFEPLTSTPAETVQRMKDDDAYFARITKELDIKPQ